MSVINDKIMRLERERDELAALVSEWRRGVYLVDGWNQAQAEKNIGDEDEWLRHLGEWASKHASDRRPDVSLAARDARMKTEALEDFAACYEVENDLEQVVMDHLRGGAKAYRKQAEGES